MKKMDDVKKEAAAAEVEVTLKRPKTSSSSTDTDQEGTEMQKSLDYDLNNNKIKQKQPQKRKYVRRKAPVTSVVKVTATRRTITSVKKLIPLELQKHHNLLERKRRMELKRLFDELLDTVKNKGLEKGQIDGLTALMTKKGYDLKERKNASKLQVLKLATLTAKGLTELEVKQRKEIEDLELRRKFLLKKRDQIEKRLAFNWK